MRVNLGALMGQAQIEFVDVDAIGMAFGKVPAPVSGDSEFWVQFGSEDCGINIGFTLADWERFKWGIDTALASVEVSRSGKAAEYAERVSARENADLDRLRQRLESLP